MRGGAAGDCVKDARETGTYQIKGITLYFIRA